ncbi:MAG: DUF3098 domain-containing protein [Tidjanibacter sp.]|nr:DUF3098 domain-containing protein [Tidjanibacter sp.]
MAQKNNTPKTQTPKQQDDQGKMPFSRRNYLLMLIGFVVIVIGFLLMTGGGSDSPDEFNYAMFSFRRITLAPIIVLAGFAFEIFAIMKRFDK